MKCTIGGSKSRNALRRKEAVIKVKANILIAALNEKQNQYILKCEDFDKGIFPWQPDSQSINILKEYNCNAKIVQIIIYFHLGSYKRRYNIINSWMLFQRNAEEVQLVKKEMFQYIQSLLKLRSERKTDIEKYRERSKVSLNIIFM